MTRIKTKKKNNYFLKEEGTKIKNLSKHKNDVCYFYFGSEKAILNMFSEHLFVDINAFIVSVLNNVSLSSAVNIL